MGWLGGKNHPPKWASGAFKEGNQARCDGDPMTGALPVYLVNEWSAMSWLAGWLKADADLKAAGLADKYLLR